jgi:hypothetical protein
MWTDSFSSRTLLFQAEKTDAFQVTGAAGVRAEITSRIWVGMLGVVAFSVETIYRLIAAVHWITPAITFTRYDI